MVDLKQVEYELYDVESRKLRNDEYTLDRQSKPSIPTEPVNYPDARKHQIVSFIKSGIRILGYAALWWSIDIAATLLILSEVVGIGEELV